MSKRVRVPIQVKQSGGGSSRDERERRRAVVEPEPSVVQGEPVVAKEVEGVAPSPPRAEAPSSESKQKGMEALKDDLEMWRDRALRLQAEIENFRKRQRRLAEDQVEANRARLLRSFLMIADDLERALEAGGGENGTLREGVVVTQRSLRQLLKQEGVEPIRAEGEPFDPTWHEAVGTVPPEHVNAERGTVVGVTRTGYRLNGRLLRPARVIVAK